MPEPYTRIGANGEGSPQRRDAAIRLRLPKHLVDRSQPHTEPHQCIDFETVTGSPSNGVTRLRATALSTHERSATGGGTTK
jgi:hypothetical protein